MNNECRPPEGTPIGTPCWLYYDPHRGPREWVVLKWFPPDLWAAVYTVGANRAARFGWRFHSVADVPHD